MRGSHRWLIGSILVLASSGAWAGGGRIDFSGAVLEPTCPTAGLVNETASHAGMPTSQRLACRMTTVDAGPTYSSDVHDLAALDLARDRLLGYFASYARSADGGDAAKVVVRTYD
ncbi:hypothetical protein ACFWZ4_06925 [Frateuria sp. GZRe12]|uniref:hypothetical protein n=1 Tax=Frateuria sp. GZRe12 TaxID=3351533 RepID=UPI003EDBB119